MDSTARSPDAYRREHGLRQGPMVHSYNDPSKGLRAQYVSNLVVGWIAEAGNQIRHSRPALRTGWVCLFLADARLLDRLAGGARSVEDCAEVADRLRKALA